MNPDQKIKTTLELFNRRYAVALFSILWSNETRGISQNLDEIYSGWQILRPSRTTFSILVKEFERTEVIEISSGSKKSEKVISINKDFIKYLKVGDDLSISEFLKNISDQISVTSGSLS